MATSSQYSKKYRSAAYAEQKIPVSRIARGDFYYACTAAAFTTSHISPMWAKPPSGRQPAQGAPFFGFPPQPVQAPQPVPRCRTRRISPARSSSSIRRRTSSLPVCSSAASCSTERDVPSFNKSNNASILMNLSSKAAAPPAGKAAAQHFYQMHSPM